jgi:hypothetical protein
VRPHFPIEKSFSQRFRFGFGIATGFEVQDLEPLKNATHVAVRIVHAHGGLLDFAKRVIGQFDDLDSAPS